MQSINEAKRITEKLSSDYEIVGKDWHAEEAKKFLKLLDARQAELGISKENARKAVVAFWAGNFPEALKLIWGNKVKTEKTNGAGGYQQIITYHIPGWGTYTEEYDYSFNTYLHKISLSLEDNPNPDYYLGQVFFCYLKKNGAGTDFVADQRRADHEAWFVRVAKVWNCLFVGFESRDLSTVLSPCQCKLINPIKPTK